VDQGVGATAATLIRASQRVRSFLGKLLTREQQVTDRPTWLLPHGDLAEQQGERQTDAVLVWTEDGNVPLDEAQVRSRYPQGRHFQRLGRHLFLVSGVAPPSTPVDALPAELCPRNQAEQLLAAARQSQDRRREAFALNDIGVLCTESGE
jgi:hypothetical protein